MTQPKPRKALVGSPTPRIGPPTPLKTEFKTYREIAETVGIHLYPWQENAGKVLTAIGPTGRWLYREVAIIVARQNGKTTLLVPLIIAALLDGRNVIHTAQTAKYPREVHEQVATLLQKHYPDALARRRAISYAVGHEEIKLLNGARYRIVPPNAGGARSYHNDLVIIDELREMKDYGFIGGAKPTLTTSTKPQIVYLSNAGTEESVVLNALKKRAEEDPNLAYLEWSAPPAVAADNLDGWLAANPAYGHNPAVAETLGAELLSYTLSGNLAIFETEHLCRWVPTMRELLVDEARWVLCKGDPGKPARPSIAVSMDPAGARAAVAISWNLGDGKVALRLLENVSPVDTDELGQKVKALKSKLGAKFVGGDSLTDAELLKYVLKPKLVIGKEYAAASAQFANLVNAGRLVWADCDPVTDDLTWTSRKPDGDDGSYHAVRAKDDRPIPASLAAIRAVWLASGPLPARAKVM